MKQRQFPSHSRYSIGDLKFFKILLRLLPIDIVAVVHYPLLIAALVAALSPPVSPWHRIEMPEDDMKIIEMIENRAFHTRNSPAEPPLSVILYAFSPVCFFYLFGQIFIGQTRNGFAFLKRFGTFFVLFFLFFPFWFFLHGRKKLVIARLFAPLHKAMKPFHGVFLCLLLFVWLFSLTAHTLPGFFLWLAVTFIIVLVFPLVPMLLMTEQQKKHKTIYCYGILEYCFNFYVPLLFVFGMMPICLLRGFHSLLFLGLSFFICTAVMSVNWSLFLSFSLNSLPRIAALFVRKKRG